MMIQYDMASYQVIEAPQDQPLMESPEVYVGATALRLQSVSEAVAIETSTRTQIPADLLFADPAQFIANQ